MARLRSRGGRSLTTSPPMRISPSLMSSNPTIIRSSVDFPQPDGPTRMTNSPSAMSRLTSLTASVPSAYRLVTWSTVISAIDRSTFHGAGGEAGHDAALEDQHHDHDGHGDDHCRGCYRARRLLELRVA